MQMISDVYQGSGFEPRTVRELNPFLPTSTHSMANESTPCTRIPASLIPASTLPPTVRLPGIRITTEFGRDELKCSGHDRLVSL